MIREDIREKIMEYCELSIDTMLGHGNLTKKILPNGLDVDSYREGFKDCLDAIEELTKGL